MYYYLILFAYTNPAGQIDPKGPPEIFYIYIYIYIRPPSRIVKPLSWLLPHSTIKMQLLQLALSSLSFGTSHARTTESGKCCHYGATVTEIPGEDNTNTYRRAAAARQKLSPCNLRLEYGKTSLYYNLEF